MCNIHDGLDGVKVCIESLVSHAYKLAIEAFLSQHSESHNTTIATQKENTSRNTHQYSPPVQNPCSP
jgi:hypothetical protein